MKPFFQSLILHTDLTQYLLAECSMRIFSRIVLCAQGGLLFLRQNPYREKLI